MEKGLDVIFAIQPVPQLAALISLVRRPFTYHVFFGLEVFLSSLELLTASAKSTGPASRCPKFVGPQEGKEVVQGTANVVFA